MSVACRAPNGQIVVKTEALEKAWIFRQKWLKAPFLRGTLAILDSMVIGNKAMKFSGEVQTQEAYQKPGAEAEKAEKAAGVKAPRSTGELLVDLLAVPLAIGALPWLLASRLLPRMGVDVPAAAVLPAIVVGALIGIFFFLKAGLDELNRIEHSDKKEKAQGLIIFAALAIGLGLGFAVFNVLPNVIAESSRFLGLRNGTAINYLAEVVKVIIFLGYIYALSFVPDVRELFRYHGAEHKAINAMEADEPVDLEHSAAQTRIHPRCGTSFAIIVLMVGFVLTPLVPRYPITGVQGNFFVDVPVRLLMELALLPIIAGISYEALRLAGKMRDQKWVNIAFAPGMWTQLITTKEPETKHIEVALAALHEVIEAEEAGEVKSSELKVIGEPAPAAG